ncbi:hypothetical protein [Paenibacillus sp. FSL R5-0519]|uniref:hypothetical protein n=1 Tax=Paenibacillus sp. FSL R5-0519 TaxID=2921648 RepID=UPI0030DA5A46
MNHELFNKINGYLEGVSNLITHFGGCYGHEYQFIKIDSPIERAIELHNTNSNLKDHKDIKYVGLSELDDWKDEIFNITARWFFSLFRLQNFGVSVKYPDTEGETPAELDKESNNVSNKLIKLLEEFFEGSNVKAYRLVTEIEWKDEFDWEQIYFSLDDEVFILDLYQWG